MSGPPNDSHNYIPVIIVFAYIVLLYLISWWSQRLSRKGGLTGYLLAGRNLPMGIIAVMLTGLAVGGVSTVGVAQRAYVCGVAAGWYNAAWAAGALFMGFFAASRYRKMEVSTLPELFENCYGPAGRALGVFGQLIIQIVITSLQYVAGGAILCALLPKAVFVPLSEWITPLQQGMFITALVFVGITLIGGLWAAGLTNIINVILIYIGVSLGAFLLMGKAMDQMGGFQPMMEHLNSLEFSNPGFDLGALGWPLVAGWFLVMIPTVLGTQAVVQISFAGKDPKAARNGFILGGLIILPVGFISAMIGIAAVVLHPGLYDPSIINEAGAIHDRTAEALPLAVSGLNPFIAGLILAGLWAADVSTACALLLGSATLVIGDIIKRFIKCDLDCKKEWLLSRGVVLAVSIITFVLALYVSQNILKALTYGLTLNVAYALITLMTLFAPSLCRKGSAIFTLGVSMLCLASWYILPSAWCKALYHPIYLVLPVTVISFFIVTLIDKRPIRTEKTAAPN